MNKRLTYIYRACFVFCGGHFELLIRGLEVRSLEPKYGSLGSILEGSQSPISVISVPDLTLADSM